MASSSTDDDLARFYARKSTLEGDQDDLTTWINVDPVRSVQTTSISDVEQRLAYAKDIQGVIDRSESLPGRLNSTVWAALLVLPLNTVKIFTENLQKDEELGDDFMPTFRTLLTIRLDFPTLFKSCKYDSF